MNDVKELVIDYDELILEIEKLELSEQTEKELWKLINERQGIPFHHGEHL